MVTLRRLARGVGRKKANRNRYQNQADATNNGLIYTAAGVNYIAVDTTVPNQAPAGVRIVSKDEYTHGLFVAKILNMPGGYCGVEGLCEYTNAP
jgi:hypothetical protein